MLSRLKWVEVKNTVARQPSGENAGRSGLVKSWWTGFRYNDLFSRTKTKLNRMPYLYLADITNLAVILFVLIHSSLERSHHLKP